ncbi:AAA family ATPase [Geodermatophilus dictyosporus]|uniref:AAA family ATPase n=1 Tax=Geodermatophilus dictyosporus TaxID=1523247 RepID=UPI00145C26B6|nr:MoxR family ATPase [Geodermatophilus dictyosporus]
MKKLIEEADVTEVREVEPPRRTIRREEYLPSRELEEAVNLAIALGRPLLLQGDPGSGKTRLAFAVAYTLGLPLEEAYVKSTSRAQDLLYTYDAVRRLYDAQLANADPDAASRAKDAANYIRLGPLGRAFLRATYGRRSVVLIDEIDKADLDFPNDLLRELDRMEFDVADLPGRRVAVPQDQPHLRPVIIVTHNEEKALPPAFLRRCIYHFVEFPSEVSFLDRVLQLHGAGERRLRAAAVDAMLAIRGLDLSRKPGLGELIDWVGYLARRQVPGADVEHLPYVGALLKNPDDQRRAREHLAAQ